MTRELSEIFAQAMTINTPEGWAEYGLIASGYPVGYVEPPPPMQGRQITLYSQRDPLWRDTVYAGGATFGAAGCYTVAVAIALSLAGYMDTPPIVAEKLRAAGCYNGAFLSRPDRIPAAYPLMRYDGPVDVSVDGPLRWHKVPADMARFDAELAIGPLITEVDFVPATAEFNQHFVICLRYTDDGNDLIIADPWDGSETRLLQRYAVTSWQLARAIAGVRLLRPKTA